MRKLLITVLFLLLTSNANAEERELSYPPDEISYKKVSRMRAAASEIIWTRSLLAEKYINKDPFATVETYKNIFGRGGRLEKEITKRDGFKIRYASDKYRSPANSATDRELELIDLFINNRDRVERWEIVELDGKQFFSFSRPITIEEPCLACHGKKEEVPEWIVKRYRHDKAYDYESGDVRGILSILTPVQNGE